MIQGVIFDLDGVIVSTDEHHFAAWKQLADELGIPFTREDNERLRGVSRGESLEIVLEKSTRKFSESEKAEFLQTKNDMYKSKLSDLSDKDILEGVLAVMNVLKENGNPIAIGSSSKNTPIILKQIGLSDAFDAIVDGNHIQKSKPDPEVFLKAAAAIGLAPENCLVVEDADAGVVAGLAAGMEVLAVGAAANNASATYRTTVLSPELILDILKG